MLQAIESNLVTSNWRISGELNISKFSVVHHLRYLIKSILSCQIVLHITKILHNFWLTLVSELYIGIFMNRTRIQTSLFKSFYLSLSLVKSCNQVGKIKLNPSNMKNNQIPLAWIELINTWCNVQEDFLNSIKQRDYFGGQVFFSYNLFILVENLNSHYWKILVNLANIVILGKLPFYFQFLLLYRTDLDFFKWLLYKEWKILLQMWLFLFV